jgi:LytS/YehU family sensor histidine kinase
MLILAAFCIVVVTIYYTKRGQQKKHALRDLKQQLKLLEMEALRSQMNPHFIFNCLNTIQFLFISGNMARANKYLTNFSALMRMTLDLLRQPITTLDLELKATQLYIELEQLQFDEGFEFRQVNKLHTQVSKIRVPSLFFQVFVENAILHGLRKTTEPRPILTLILEETEDQFIFHICDNGPGISKQKKEDHTSMGIKLLRDRFALKSEIYNWQMDFFIRENETIQEDIKTEIIITFGKVLLESTEDEYLDSR